MKKYGREHTRLTLSPAAEAIYSVIDPFDIYEYETNEGFRYFIRGVIEDDDLTAERVTSF